MPISLYESDVRTGRVPQWFDPEQIREPVEEVICRLARWNNHMIAPIKFDAHAFIAFDPFGINNFPVVPVWRGIFNRAPPALDQSATFP